MGGPRTSGGGGLIGEEARVLDVWRGAGEGVSTRGAGDGGVQVGSRGGGSEGGEVEGA
jgi:hypothetical protein